MTKNPNRFVAISFALMGVAFIAKGLRVSSLGYVAMGIGFLGIAVGQFYFGRSAVEAGPPKDAAQQADATDGAPPRS